MSWLTVVSVSRGGSRSQALHAALLADLYELRSSAGSWPARRDGRPRLVEGEDWKVQFVSEVKVVGKKSSDVGNW